MKKLKLIIVVIGLTVSSNAMAFQDDHGLYGNDLLNQTHQIFQEQEFNRQMQSIDSSLNRIAQQSQYCYSTNAMKVACY